MSGHEGEAGERGLEELRASEARARALLDAIPDLIFRIGADGVYRGFKAERTADLVTDPDDIVGSALHERLPVEAAERIMGAAWRALHHGTVEAVDYDLEIRGEDRHFEGRVVAFGEDEFLLIVREFTERRRHEELLRRERDFTRAVVRSASSFLVLLDPAGHLLGINRSFEQAFGFLEDEVRGRPFWDVYLPPDEVPRAIWAFGQTVAGSKPEEREFPLVTRDGERRIVWWSATPVRDSDNRLRFIFNGVDVTERKRHEEELRRSRARIVEASDAERRRLERNLHDGAQQQLVFVSQALHLARRAVDVDPERTKALLDQALEQLGAAHEELRELARGLHPAVLTERGLAAAVAGLAARSPVSVTIDAPDGVRFPGVVETAAYYVVAEALTNVAKYAGAASASVRVASDGGRAVVEVRDDGAGGADPAAGSGLRGLADRVEALGGSFRVESPPGGGTSLRAEFPLAG